VNEDCFVFREGSFNFYQLNWLRTLAKLVVLDGGGQRRNYRRGCSDEFG